MNSKQESSSSALKTPKEEKRRMLEECAMLEKFVKDATESKTIRPLVQRYGIVPSFVRSNNPGQDPRMRFYPPPRSAHNHTLTYNRFLSRTNFAPKPTANNGTSAHLLTPFSKTHTKVSSKKWVRPPLGSASNVKSNSTVMTSKSISTCSSSSALCTGKANSIVKDANDDSIQLSKTNQNSQKSIMVGVGKYNTELDVSKKTLVSTGQSSVAAPPISLTTLFKGSLGPIKPIVPLNSKTRFRIAKLGESSIHTATTSRKSSNHNSFSDKVTLKSKYKVDRRRPKLTPKKIRLDIAQRTLVAGLNLSQRRSLSAQMRYNASKNFVIRQFSMKRIRKSSTQSLSYNQIRNVSTSVSPTKGGLTLVNKNWRGLQIKRRKLSQSIFSIQNEKSMLQGSQSQSQLELNSHSMSQTATVRLATRAVQLSRQRLAGPARKLNKFCSFYNRFGICKRKDDGKCPFVHDPRQRPICSKFLNKGKCELNGCTLSHDIKEGKIPPCTFFNKGSCSRDNCLFLHVMSTPTKKKLRQYRFGLGSPNKPEKQSMLIENKTKEKNKTNCMENVEKVESRYYEMRPDSQPIISIIPRRYPKGVAEASATDNGKDSGLPDSSDDESEKSSSESNESVTEIDYVSDTSLVSEQNDDNGRRQRVLGKVSKFKKDSSDAPTSAQAPSFLCFNPN